MLKPAKVFIPRFDVRELLIRLKEMKFEAKRERRILKVADPAHKKAFFNGKIETSERAIRLVEQYLVVPYNKQQRGRK